MKYYQVSFKFNIPVVIDDSDQGHQETKIEAYYAARKQFSNFSINEADVKFVSISEDEYNASVSLDKNKYFN